MIYDLIAAIAFLTRLPVGRRLTFDSKDVARAARWFPLAGALLGAIYIAVLWIIAPIFPSFVTAVLLVGIDAALTGAMHLDGLADAADGFGGGTTREDVLRIMRDHAIGAFGAVALVLALALKIAALAVLIDAHRAIIAVIVAPVLGRWSAVLLGATQPYARSGEGKLARFGRTELVIATITALAIAAAFDYRRGLAAAALVAIVSAYAAWRCRRRIGGVTGDTLGANITISECLILLLFTALR